MQCHLTKLEKKWPNEEREKGNRNRFRNNGTRNTEWNFDSLRMDFFVCLILCVCVLSFLYCSVESSFPSSFVLVSPLVRVCISFYLGSFIGGCFSLDPNQTNFSCCFFLSLPPSIDRTALPLVNYETHQRKYIATNTHNLDDFICTQSGKGPGIVYSLSQFVYTFYKLPNAQLNNTQN